MESRATLIFRALDNAKARVNEVLAAFEDKPTIDIHGDLEGITIYLKGGSPAARNAVAVAVQRTQTGYNGASNLPTTDYTKLFISAKHSFCR